ncbi:hypothetical protein QGM71_02735 [Virgibacillus sp. C22-A2]|uniref:Uncharacterized protein n=1 Tax=Virgibacillus tibetensis TaxID=3042313 RepID=A0ABU6KAP6_9BACI|nr:hypothetical protein [Virgibacillus sp. C22-A2]
MSNIPVDLLHFNGKIGPQYLDVDDKSGGPDGTMKPITRDELQEMILLNFPELQNVSDQEALAKLESMQQDIADTKQTQAQILDRLNQPIDTQLTGSKVVKETLIERTVRNSNNNANTLEIPDGATGCLFIHIVYGITGSFGVSEGHRIRIYPYEGSVGRPLFGNHTSPSEYDSMPNSRSISSSTSYTIVFHRDAEQLFVDKPTNLYFKTPILFKNLRYDLLISGTFGAGEGVDSELIVYWIFNG